MHYPKYTDVLISNDYHVHEFISSGPNGSIVKRIQFQETVDPTIYNLGFGDKLRDGIIDDTADSKNGDRDIILATVVEAIYKFTSVYPQKSILFFGSNEVRTRLYRMAISKNYELLNRDFHIFGLNENAGELVVDRFKSGKTFVGFLVRRKH